MNQAPSASDAPRILLVDDEETVRRVTGRLLEKLGYRVHAVADGSEALRVIESGDEFDLVLTDVVMPGISGIEMADRLRRINPDQRILFTSGYTTREFGRPPGEPPQPFMPKPFSLDDLAHAVRDALDGPPDPDADDPHSPSRPRSSPDIPLGESEPE